MEDSSVMPPAATGSLAPRTQPERRSFIWPVILILLGSVLLGQNVGVLPADTWLSLWQLWPLLMVLAGVELILGHSSLGTAVATVLLVIVVMSVIGSLYFFAPAFRSGNAPIGQMSSSAMVVDRMTQELGNTNRAVVDLRHGAGRLGIEALPAGNGQLIDAELGHGRGSTVERSVSGRDGETYVRLESKTGWNGFPMGGPFRQDWTVRLSPDVPAELRVNGGASSVAADLSRLKVTKLTVESGASEVNVTLPSAAGFTETQIKTGAAGVRINVPAGVAARIGSQSGLSETDIDEFRFPWNGSYYQSPDYSTAANRVDIRLESGISEITVR